MKKSFKTIVILGTLSLLLSNCSVFVSGSSDGGNSSSSSSKEQKTFTITWKNFDGSILEVDGEVSKDIIPTFDSPDPAREETAQFSYVWTGWTPEISPVASDATYTAVFKEETKKYTVTWKNYDGEVLDTEEYPYGVKPEFKGEEPTRDDTVEHTFDFDGWSPTVDEVVENVAYTACFKEKPRQYDVTWKNDDGSVLRIDKVDYGKTPSFGEEVPIKESTAQFAYIFNDWFPSVFPVGGDAEYVATYNSEIRKYTVTWQNDDGTILEVDNDIMYGTVPSYDGEEPTKSKRGIEYTFNGWLPVDEYVTGDVTYTAQYIEKGVFSFEPINYEMKEGYKLSDINGAPWINSNVSGELNKIEKPSLNDDFYASVNYEDIKYGGKGAYDYCDDAAYTALSNFYTDIGSNTTTNGAIIRNAYKKFASGSVNQVSNYLNSLNLDSYLSSREVFSSSNSLLNILPLDDGYEVEFNDGYFSGYLKDDYTKLGFLWLYDDTAYYVAEILKILSGSNVYNLGLSQSDLDTIRYNEYNLLSQASEKYNANKNKTNKYTVDTIPWEPIKSALLDLGLESNTKIEVKIIYENPLNEIYNNIYIKNRSLLRKMVISRLAYDCRFFTGTDTYRQINQYISNIGGWFGDETYLFYSSDDQIAKVLSRVAFPALAEQTYIELEGSEGIKEQVTQLIDDVLDAYKTLADDSWLTDKTKDKMKAKLRLMRYSSCYCDAYKNIAKIGDSGIASKNLFELFDLYSDAMVDEAVKYNVDKYNDYGFMHSWTVNAFYSPTSNSFVILNGLAKGLLGNNVEEKYGMLATVIGHEITHAFDSNGSQFNEYGAQRNWWQLADRLEFNDRVAKLKTFYNQISLKKNYYVDGNIIDGEATADLGGMKVALMLAEKVDNFDYDKFFRAYANLWLTAPFDISYVQNRASDAHPFNYLRVNVVVSQFDEFVDTYDIKPGDGMYVPEEQRIKVW